VPKSGVLGGGGGGASASNSGGTNGGVGGDGYIRYYFTFLS
jgi:hypothetical protein